MSGFYDSGLNAISDGDIDYTADTIAVALVKDTYIFSSGGHDNFDDVSPDVAGTPVALSTKSRSQGRHYADPAVFSAVPGIDTVIGIVVFKVSGTPSTSTLIGFIDRRSDTTPVDITTNGDDITVIFNGGIVYTI